MIARSFRNHHTLWKQSGKILLHKNYTKTENGKYKVHLTVESKKLRADGKGNETEIDINDYMDIEVLGEDGKELYLKKYKINKAVMDFEIIVDEIPTDAGIDPYVNLIDRNRDDNVIEVEEL